MRRLGAAVTALAAIGVCLLLWATPAQAKSFAITSLSTDAQLRPDATMDVVEEVTYDFAGGPFTVGIRSFEPRSRAQVVDFEATDEQGRALQVTPPDQSISGEWEWEFAPTSDGRRTFTVTYQVRDAATVGPDVGELYWKFLGSDHPGVGSVQVRVHVPGGYPPATPETPPDDTGVVRAWAHGPGNGTISNTGSEVDLDVTDVPAGQFVEARIAVPAAAFTVTPTGDPRLARILSEEQAFIEDREAADTRRLAGGIEAGIVSVLGLAAFWVVWRRWGKEPKAGEDIGDYWREPLQDPPAVTIANLGFGTVASSALSATVVDLAQRGHLAIEEEAHGDGWRQATTYRFTWKGNRDDHLLQHEEELLERLFRGRPSTTSTEFAEWARTNPGTSQEFWRDWKQDVTKEVDTRGYLETGRVAPWVWWAGILAVLIVSGVVALGLGTFLGLIPLGVAGLVLVLGILLRRRTQLGAEEAARAEALRHFLRDFSTLDEAPVASMAIWERYLVAAVTLGVASQLVRGMALKVPEVASSPNFAVWYVGLGAYRLDGIGGFGSGFGTMAVGALSPSTTGSGGGFSGGGGGGGGGGGFGAR